MNMRSPIYFHPVIYHLAMKLLYGKHFDDRYKAITGLIPENAEVSEYCMGDGYLYRNYLSKKNIRYTGYDLNRCFVRYAIGRGINARIHILEEDPVPVSDYIILQAGLYQFIPNHREIVKKLLASASKALIISEPVKNLSDSRNPLVSLIAKYAANPGTKHPTRRFQEKSLLSFFKEFSEFTRAIKTCDGKEIIGVFGKPV